MELQATKIAQALSLREQYHGHREELESCIKQLAEQMTAVNVTGVTVPTKLDRYKVPIVHIMSFVMLFAKPSYAETAQLDPLGPEPRGKRPILFYPPIWPSGTCQFYPMIFQWILGKGTIGTDVFVCLMILSKTYCSA